MMNWNRYVCTTCNARWTMPEVTPDYPDNVEVNYCPGCGGHDWEEVDDD